MCTSLLVTITMSIKYGCCYLPPFLATDQFILHDRWRVSSRQPERGHVICWFSKDWRMPQLNCRYKHNMSRQPPMLLSNKVLLLQFMHHCVTSLLQCGQSSTPEVSSSLSFLFCCLPSLSHLLTFCRDTERSSTCTFPSISPLLGALFKSSYSLLKVT